MTTIRLNLNGQQKTENYEDVIKDRGHKPVACSSWA